MYLLQTTTSIGETNWVAIIMFFAFVALTMYITYWASRKTKTTSEFYAAGRSITGFLNGLALAGVQSIDINSENNFWYFESYGFNLNLNYRSMVGPASEYFSGGITLVS